MARREDIPIGRQNAISCRDLAKLWVCSDREARRQISVLRVTFSDDGMAILSSSIAPAGYWRSCDRHEVEAFVQEMGARARHTFLALCDARRVLARLEEGG